jgi:hypothetical protein
VPWGKVEVEVKLALGSTSSRQVVLAFRLCFFTKKHGCFVLCFMGLLGLLGRFRPLFLGVFKGANFAFFWTFKNCIHRVLNPNKNGT